MNRLLRASAFFLSGFVAVTGTAATAAPDDASSAPTAAALARLLDEHTPAAERQAIFAAAEHSAVAGDTEWQYIVGSLLSRKTAASPVPSDPGKALVYLSNAAIHGKVLAMAKMAEVELAAGNAQEAMNWAQIYAHYQALPSADARPAQDYVSELIARISDKLDAKKLPQVQQDVDSFVAQNDASIKLGPQSIAGAHPLHGPPLAAHRFHQSSVNPVEALARPRSSFADYLIAFKPDGTTDQTWQLDIVPDTRASEILHGLATTESTQPEQNAHGLRYALITVIYDDGRYHVRGGHVVGGQGI